MRRVGLSFQKIAKMLTAAGRGGDTAEIEMPPAGLEFPMDYSIAPMGVYQAYAKVIDEAPWREAAQWRKEQVERCAVVRRKMQRW